MPGLTALIPLDGTALSESAYDLLPFLKKIGFEKVELITVWESGWDEKEELTGKKKDEMTELIQRGQSFAATYLSKQAESVRAMGFEADENPRIGRPADAVIEAAKSERVDMILMATHGRDGLLRARLGSTADKVIRDATCPSLVIGPNVETDMASYNPERIFVPLDGSAMSESVLPVARWLAKRNGATLDLARVVSINALSYDAGSGFYPVDMLSAMEDAGRVYLDRMAESIKDVPVATTLLVGSPADQILSYLKEHPAGLVVMASHARSGMARAALGSVADRLLHGPSPVLIIRPAEEMASRLVDEANAAG